MPLSMQKLPRDKCQKELRARDLPLVRGEYSPLSLLSHDAHHLLKP